MTAELPDDVVARPTPPRGGRLQWPRRKGAPQRVEVEFSLALNNRTGKFFFCRDMIDSCGDLISSINYWRIRSATLPSGLYRRVLGRLMIEEATKRVRHQVFDAVVPRLSRRAPVIFTDPLQVLLYRLKPGDLVVCHDLGPITHPELYSPGVERVYRRVFEEIAAASPHILFVSRNSQAEFERLYGKAYGSAHIAYPALRSEVTVGAPEPVPGIDRPFLLTVGAVGTRKNQAAAIRAFEQAGLADRGFNYVICGGPEPGYDAVRASCEAARNVHLTGYVKDTQLRWLYANAHGFVLPSLLEGFGLPAVEAISGGLVPLVSQNGALHEVTGDRGVLVDPLSVDSIADGLTRLALMPPEEKAQRLGALTLKIREYAEDRTRESWRSAIEQIFRTGPNGF
jgi:glycosyltransferase involved in cell wall biosynthesis